MLKSRFVPTHHSADRLYSHVLLVMCEITVNEPILQSMQGTGDSGDVVRLADVRISSISNLLSRYGLSLRIIEPGCEIPGSYWGEEEAGLIGNDLLVRSDTPVHSMLHETCHYICMDRSRREGVHTDAGGDYDEENAVCYLQILMRVIIC